MGEIYFHLQFTEMYVDDVMTVRHAQNEAGKYIMAVVVPVGPAHKGRMRTQLEWRN